MSLTTKLKRLTPEERNRFFIRYVVLWDQKYREKRQVGQVNESRPSLKERAEASKDKKRQYSLARYYRIKAEKAQEVSHEERVQS